MKLQTKPLSVLERTNHYLRSGAISETPAWFNVVAANPPVKNLVRQANFKQRKSNNQTLSREKYSQGQFHKTRSEQHRASVYKPVKFQFLQDELRQLFYQQHPWELADAKVLIENSGNDSKSQDWSRIVQLNKKLDGESVVQRTLYLMRSEGVADIEQAYNQARYEYYLVKMKRELEVQVVKEESLSYGSSFKTNVVDFGFNKEAEVIEKWKVDAIEEGKKFASTGAPKEEEKETSPETL